MQIDAQEKDKQRRIQQKQRNIAKLNVEIEDLDGLIDKNSKEIEETKRDLMTNTKESENQRDAIQTYADYKQVELDKVINNLQLKTAHDKFENADKQIKEAINKTGQIESNVGKFSTLAHGSDGCNNHLKILSQQIKQTPIAHGTNQIIRIMTGQPIEKNALLHYGSRQGPERLMIQSN